MQSACRLERWRNCCLLFLSLPGGSAAGRCWNSDRREFSDPASWFSAGLENGVRSEVEAERRLPRGGQRGVVDRAAAGRSSRAGGERFALGRVSFSVELVLEASRLDWLECLGEFERWSGGGVGGVGGAGERSARTARSVAKLGASNVQLLDWRVRHRGFRGFRAEEFQNNRLMVSVCVSAIHGVCVVKNDGSQAVSP